MEITASRAKVFEIEKKLLSRRFELLESRNKIEEQGNPTLVGVVNAQFYLVDNLYENIYDAFFERRKDLLDTLTEEQVVKVCKEMLDEIIAELNRQTDEAEVEFTTLRTHSTVASDYRQEVVSVLES